MTRLARFILGLLVALALLTWTVSGVVQTTTREWFERDVSEHARLAMVSATRSLADAWYDPDGLKTRLLAIDRNQHVIGVAACNVDLTTRSMTPDLPEVFRCQALGAWVRAAGTAAGDTNPKLQEWSTVATLPTGRVYVAAMPVVMQGQILGFVILAHDLSYIQRREARAQTFLLIVFGILAVLAFGVPLLVARRVRDDWSTEVRKLLHGGGKKEPREFQPILSDVRELIARMADEREDLPGQWTADRLRQILNRNLHGEKIVILANRQPYSHIRGEDGSIEVQHPASGLVTALEPIMRACSGVWVAHGSGNADRETVDRSDHVRVPPEEESYHIRRIWLSEEEQQGHYYGFSNEGLWPLCHIAHTRPTFRSEDWEYYKQVNQKFSDAVCGEVDSEDPIIMVEDYHFALAPAMIRKRMPAATIIAFWHIPWPNAERMGICPWHNEILEGLLGSSIVGFHTQLHCNNFLDSVDRYLETRRDREQNAVIMHGQRTLVRPYPISLEWPVHWAEMSPDSAECRAKVFQELGLKPDALLGLGVDRLDYTKGIEERLAAVEMLLDRYPRFRGRFTFVQLAEPSRTKITRYRDLNEAVELLARRINDRFGTEDYRPVVLLRSHHEPPEVFRYYRAADLCYVSSLHDGMNLVAKEFVAARTDLRGVLILSEFTGAAQELTEALIVNPYDLVKSSDALAAALSMPEEEQLDRMQAMRSMISRFNVYRWAGKMLADAAHLRSQERLSGRLAERMNVGTNI
jgi:trehalose 6-phosphate synthase